MNCPYDPKCTKGITGHEHGYTPGPEAQKQCTCGSRRWYIHISSGHTPLVNCKSCERPSRISTVYEAGRYDQLTGVPRAATA